MKKLMLILGWAGTLPAQFVIELPASAVDPGVTADQISCWATFVCDFGSGEIHSGIPIGPWGDPPAFQIVFMPDWDGCPSGPLWSSYPYVTDGELSVCGQVRRIGSVIQMQIVWWGNLVLDQPFPPCPVATPLLSIQRVANGFRLVWPAVPGASHDRLEMRTGLDQPWTTLATQTGTTFLATGGGWTATCLFRVVAVSP
ncbi:MAG: hypothetical protein Q8O14_08770 [bacterium]|nr:hypothetical protein [bacterium]